MHRRTFLKGSGALLAGTNLLGLEQGAAEYLPASGPLKVDARNPRYFTDGSGRTIFLTGSHTWANFQDIGTAPVPVFDWEGYLAMLKTHNHNFMRFWAWQQSAWASWTADKILFEPTLYLRTGPGLAVDGGAKFDLKKFNPVYFDRMRARLIECRNLNIYCAVQLFQGFSSNKPGCGRETWSGHPYNAQNNINGVDGDRDGDKVLDYDQPAVRDLHIAYLEQVVDTVTGLPNVLYEVINEGGNKEWDWWVVDVVHKMESDKGYRHPVGITGAGNETMEQMRASPADWISPFGHIFQWDPPVWDGLKVSVSDTDHLWGHGGTVAWAWKSFVRGHNTLLMDPWEPAPGASCPDVNWGPRPGSPLRNLNRRDDPTWEPIRRALGNTRYYADRMDLVSMTPSADMASTGYCLANPEKEFLVFFPDGDFATVDLSKVKGNVVAEWMHPVEGTIVPGGSAPGGGTLRFDVPFLGPAVLHLIRQ